MFRRLLGAGLALVLFVLMSGSVRAAEITVNTAADQLGGNPAECSLREAILAAILNAVADGCAAGQAAPVVDVIKFSIGTGVQTITINKIDNTNVALDEILDPVIIDGTTQPGYAGTPLIELRRGTGPGLEGAYALRVRAGGSGSTIKGLAISDWSQRTNADLDHDDPGFGVRVDGANNVTIQGNWFGLRANGISGGGNSADIMILNGSQNTQVGGSTAAARNVFAGSSPGVSPDSILVSGATTTGTRIQGNLFGLTPDGTARLDGATITIGSGASSVTIGGPNPGERNIMGVSVIEFSSTGTGHQIVGNWFGVNVNGVDLPGGNGITIGAANSTVRNNVLNSATVGGSGTVVQGNLVGLAPDGVTVLGGGGSLSISGSGHTVGGTSAAERNVVAGSASTGLSISGTNHVVKGNFVGTDVTGQLARANANGVFIGGTGHQFGGTGAGEGNVVSGNTGHGIQIGSFAESSGHTIAGNRIGVAADGITGLGNGGRGIFFNSSGTTPVTIGGTSTGAGNIIANNGAQGIRNDFSTRQGVSILGNSIYGNGSLGIGLSFSSTPRANDANDVDTGPNSGQNYPVLTSAVPGSSTTIAGTLNSTPNTNNYRIELFSNAACDGTGNGEGQTFLGSTTVNTDANGNGAFNVVVPATLTAGTPVTATATDPNGNTSELSQCLNVGGSTPAGFTVTPTSGLTTTEAGGQATFIVRLNTVPTSTVTVGLSSSDATEGTVSPASLTFQPNSTALNAQTVTVTGVDDAAVDGAIAYAIVTGAATSGDPAYNGLNAPDVAVTNQDNEVACPSQRPNVQVTSTKGATGTLNVTVQAGFGTISKIQFGAPRQMENAVVSVVGGQQNQTGTFTFTPAGSTATVQLIVQSPNRALQTMVPFTVTDGCGAWPTFVGGGAGSF